MKKVRKHNNLINEKSPYLLQHSGNPVNWYAWNEDSLKLAKDENKPIFLSVGYSTCYWCHVMERECFENEKIANLLNKNYINIKVDREERTDIDRVYMSALQSMTGSGGWPMNMFLTPDLKPFYGATYIPPKEKYGRAGFEDVIDQIVNLWKNKRSEIIDSSEKIFKILQSALDKKIKIEEIKIDDDIFDNAFEKIKNIFDFENGGFGIGNKFPRPVVLNFLLSYFYYTKNEESLDIVTFTLKKMCDGGIFDHLGGGFHRYSVDTYWRVPHFEKMLYDQAQIVNILLDTYSITKNDLFLRRAENTLNYVLENLTDNDGGFYSAEDAESVIEESSPDYKEEGYYYLWEENEIVELLGKENAKLFNFVFGIKYEGNTISDPHNVFKNRNVLFKDNNVFETSKKFNKSPDEIKQLILKSKNILLQKRNSRIKPHLDDKILTSWNGLMISAFAKAYQVIRKEKYKKAATRCYGFINKNLFNKKINTLYHRYRDKETKFNATLDDYAFLIKAAIELYETTFDLKYLTDAILYSELAISKLYDNNNNAFFDSEPELKDIILKTKDNYDGAEPAGNSIMIENLFRLGRITQNIKFNETAEKSLKYFYHEVNKMPFSSPQMLNNIFFMTKIQKDIIFTGNPENINLKNSIKFLQSSFLPFKILFHANNESLNTARYLKEIISDFNSFKIYICENYKCNLPVDDLESLQKLI